MPNTVSANSSGAQTHLNMLQNVISRMAGNSAVCKTLCATLVSTVGAVAYAAKSPEGLWIAVVPILLFAFLDARYLALEHGFRKTYNDFVSRLNHGTVQEDELFKIAPPVGYTQFGAMVTAFKSWSVWVPYAALLALTFLIMCFVRFAETTTQGVG